ncbi:MAG: hypothetical protein GEU89_10270 [Kiloniellaceae bacterium]|nr:hypothetical protein [Kiloniellaceae bacterium]
MATVDRSNEIRTRAADRPTWAIRPGVRFPDWSVIHSPKAEGALGDIFAVLKIERWWDNVSDIEDRLRCILLQDYVRHGRAPTLPALAAMAGISEERAREVLAQLRERDLVVFDAEQDRLSGAYPFTDCDTEHRVLFDGLSVNAMCAIDALGAGAMYERDIVVHSRCRACDRSISVEIQAHGTALASYSPQRAVVWTGLRYADNCAASSLCTVMAFFCSDEHLEEWRTANHPDIQGHRLSMEEAHELGMAIFGPMLRAAS